MPSNKETKLLFRLLVTPTDLTIEKWIKNEIKMKMEEELKNSVKLINNEMNSFLRNMQSAVNWPT